MATRPGPSCATSEVTRSAGRNSPGSASTTPSLGRTIQCNFRLGRASGPRVWNGAGKRIRALHRSDRGTLRALCTSAAALPEMVSTVCSLTDRHPGLVVVLACLADYYEAMRPAILPPHLDRLEMNPAPQVLKTARSGDEVLALVRRRLEVLDAEAGLPARTDADDFFPSRAKTFCRCKDRGPARS